MMQFSSPPGVTVAQIKDATPLGRKLVQLSGSVGTINPVLVQVLSDTTIGLTSELGNGGTTSPVTSITVNSVGQVTADA